MPNTQDTSAQKEPTPFSEAFPPIAGPLPEEFRSVLTHSPTRPFLRKTDVQEQSLQERLRAGTFTFPASPAESRAQGFTGEFCLDCGNYTLRQTQNLTHTYLICDWCDSRVPIGPL